MKTPIARQLMQVALGREVADLVITGGRLLNVFTGELLDDMAVAVKGERIAWVGKNYPEALCGAARIIDAKGRVLVPGFIDGHTHIAWMAAPEAFLKVAMTGGTTTIITEVFEPYPVCGLAGIIDLLDALADQPVKCYATAPAMVSISPRTKGMAAADLDVLLARDDIVGMGEAYWQGVLQDVDIYLPAFERTRAAGKTLEGHTAGANEKNLNAYAALGVSSCHEPIQAGEVIDRLRLGFHVMIREGSVRRELEAVSKICGTGIDFRRMILVSDGLSPDALLSCGYMEYIVQKAIDLGFPPAEAIRMATLNVAEHFRLDDRIGAIAPGRYADILIIPDLTTISPEMVISSGRVIAQQGKRLIDPRPHAFSDQSRSSIRLPGYSKAADFSIKIDSGKARQRVRVMELATPLVTRERQVELPVDCGEIKADRSLDLLKIAAIDRAIGPGDQFVGLITGFGLASGAVAYSATWDSADIIVIGADDADMALAVNRLADLQGGAVVAERGEIIAELPLPVFGVVSNAPVEAILRQANAVGRALSERGVPLPDPLLTMGTLTSAAIPFFRICEEGLVNLKDGRVVGLFVD